MEQQNDLTSKPEVQEIVQTSETLLAVGTAYSVASAADYQVAGDELKRVKDAQKKLDALRKSMTQPLDAAKKAILDFFRTPEEKLARAESGIKRAMLAFSEEEERKRREIQARAEAEARKERERLEKQAAKAAEKGQVEKAAVLEQAAAATVAPIAMPEPARVTGVSTREVWRFEVVDPALVPRDYLAVDEKKIGGVVRALKGDTRIPGVRVWSEKTLAAAAG